jgi:hypothetical protein
MKRVLTFATRLPLLMAGVVLLATLSGCNGGQRQATTPTEIQAAVGVPGRPLPPSMQAKEKAAEAQNAELGQQMLAAHQGGKPLPPGVRQP